MKKHLSRLLCLVLIMALFIPCVSFPASAATYRTGANSASTSYANSVYYQNFLKVPITGDNVTDVLAIALSQLGYHEGGSTSDMSGKSSSAGNYTEYNYNMGKSLIGAYGGSAYPWCASFISWCLYQSHCTNQGSESDLCRNHVGDSKYIWREIDCGAWTPNLRSAGCWQYSASKGGSYTPKSGDLIFFRNNAHIGIVLYCEGGTIYTVEGNTSDASGLEPEGGGVYYKSYSVNSSLIDGYGTMPYVKNENVKKIDYSGKNPTAGYYIANATKYVYADAACTRYAYYGDGVQCYLPKYTMIMVESVSADGVGLKITYDGVEGYVKNTLDTARMLQITSTEALEGPEANLASNRDYTVSVTNSPIVEPEWGTNYSASLTDGKAANTFNYGDGSWFALSVNHNAPGYVGSITVDFDKVCNISKLRLHLANQTDGAVKAPKSITAYGSVDGVNYSKIGTMPLKSDADKIYWSNLDLSNVTAGSVKFEFALDGTFAYVNEIEVHGTATSQAYPIVPDEGDKPIEGDKPVENEKYSLSFNANGGIGEIGGVTLDNNTKFTLPQNSFTAPAGMQFKCWEVNGTQYNANDVITITNNTVVTAIWEKISEEPPHNQSLRGDINASESIDARDYLLLKRAYFGTYTMECAPAVADINDNGQLDARDYLLLKRMYFGTYTLEEDLVWVYNP